MRLRLFRHLESRWSHSSVSRSPQRTRRDQKRTPGVRSKLRQARVCPPIFSHAAAALAISAPFGRELSWRARVLGVIGAMAPDADVVGFRFGIHYGDMVGHRGLSHSLFFAVGLALVFMFRLRLTEPQAKRWPVCDVSVPCHRLAWSAGRFY